MINVYVYTYIRSYVRKCPYLCMYICVDSQCMYIHTSDYNYVRIYVLINLMVAYGTLIFNIFHDFIQ